MLISAYSCKTFLFFTRYINIYYSCNLLDVKKKCKRFCGQKVPKINVNIRFTCQKIIWVLMDMNKLAYFFHKSIKLTMAIL